MTTEFASLHIPGDPLILYNIWDAGSALAVAKSNPAAIATGSWAMAKAQGYNDGEVMPFDQFTKTVEHIIEAVALPVTVDFEAGYAADHQRLRSNIDALNALGTIGVNFEDRIIGETDLRSAKDQCERIEVLRKSSDTLFINARCDLMFDGADLETQKDRIDDLIERSKAYADAGADGFFVPGIADPSIIQTVCDRCPMPVNIMRMTNAPIAEFSALGVARISHGPRPYLKLMQSLTEAAMGLMPQA